MKGCLNLTKPLNVMVVDAVQRNPSQMGIRGKIQGKNEKSLQKFSGEAPRAQY
jgi:hypothetical protein